MNLIGPMIIQLQEESGDAILIADHDANLVIMFERQKGGRPLRHIRFPDRLSAEQHADPGQMTGIFRSLLHDGGWRERVLDDTEQRQMLLTALRDVSVRYMQLEAAAMATRFGSSPLSGKVQ